MTAPVKRYNMDVGKFGNVDAYESEHGRWVKRDDYDRLEQERAEQWRLRRDAEADRDTKAAVIAELKDELDNIKRSWGLLHAENEKLRENFDCALDCKDAAIKQAQGLQAMLDTERAQVEAMREALLFGCKALAQITSSDGSGHADISLSCLRAAGVEKFRRERLVEIWKSQSQWRIDAASHANPAETKNAN